MIFKAKATILGQCAYAKCHNKADKIYSDNKWKILSCSLAHANIARSEIDKIPLEQQEDYFK